jgi:hypothetical protein
VSRCNSAARRLSGDDTATDAICPHFEDPVRDVIARTPMKFTSGLYWNETDRNVTYRTWNEDEHVYVGPRTPELDAAWDDISLRTFDSLIHHYGATTDDCVLESYSAGPLYHRGRSGLDSRHLTAARHV